MIIQRIQRAVVVLVPPLPFQPLVRQQQQLQADPIFLLKAHQRTVTIHTSGSSGLPSRSKIMPPVLSGFSGVYRHCSGANEITFSC